MLALLALPLFHELKNAKPKFVRHHPPVLANSEV